MSTEVAAKAPPLAPAWEEVDLHYDVIVHLGVERRADRYELWIYPERGQDTVIFHHRESRERPSPRIKHREARWVVHGLAPGQKVTIAGKEGAPQVFGHRFEIEYPSNSVRSGLPEMGPRPNEHELHWHYNVILTMHDAKEPLDFVDPCIIIKDEP